MVRDSREREMHAMRGSKDLYSRILGGIGKGRRNCNIFNQEVDAHLFMFLSSPKQTKCTLENDVIHHCKMKRSFLVAHDFDIRIFFEVYFN